MRSKCLRRGGNHQTGGRVKKAGEGYRVWYSPQDVAELLGISKTTVINDIESGKLVAAYRTSGGHYRIRLEDYKLYAGTSERGTGCQL